MKGLLSSISSRFSAGDGRQAFRSSRNLAAARVPTFGTLRNLKDDSGLTFGTLRNPEDDSGWTFGNFRMYAEERGLTFGVGGTPVDRRRLKSQTSKRQRLLNVSFKKRTRKRRNVLVSSFVGRLKVCTHTPNFKMSKTFECFLKNKPRPTGYPYSTHKGSRMYTVNRQS